MLLFKIDIKKLECELENVSCWEDWFKIEKDIFQIDTWLETPIDVTEKDLKKPPVEVDNSLWEPTTNAYDIDPYIIYLYEKMSWKVFEKLEPEAVIENKKNPDQYGKWCVFCRIWTRKYQKNNCPLCGKVLCVMPMND